MADVLSPPSFTSTFPSLPYPPQSKLFEPTPLFDKFAAPPYERPSTASGILRPGHTKNGDGPDLTMNQQPTLQRHRRHREYYIDGGDIVFLVRPPPTSTIVNRQIAHRAVREPRLRTCFSACTGQCPLPVPQSLASFTKSVADNSHFFERESPIFRKQLAGYGTRERSGCSDADPCVLDGVTVDDFSRFLWVFYNP